MRSFVSRFGRDQSGATAIEYGMICGLIFVVIVTAITGMFGGADGMFTRAQTAVDANLP